MDTVYMNRLKRAKTIDKFLEIIHDSSTETIPALKRLEEFRQTMRPEQNIWEAKCVEMEEEADNFNGKTAGFCPGQEIVFCSPAAGVPYSGRTWTGMTGIGMAGTSILIEAFKENLHNEYKMPYQAMRQADGLSDAAVIYPSEQAIYSGQLQAISTGQLQAISTGQLQAISTGQPQKISAGLPKMTYAGQSVPVTAAYLIGEGGILRTLNRLADDCGTGMRIMYEAVPVKQITVEVCERFGINPWQLLSGGCLLFITSNGYELCRRLKTAGFDACTIGCLTDDHKKLICHEYDESEEEGSCLNRPEPDEILNQLRKLSGLNS